MNIFVVDTCPERAAQALHDRHVVKMALETAQLLCTVAHAKGLPAPYRPTHSKHPCTLWAGASRQNAEWLRQHGLALCAEYTHRYGRRHACESIIFGLSGVLETLPNLGLTPFAQAMPDPCRGPNAVDAYRRYYRLHKLEGARYSRRTPPDWAQEEA